MSDLIGRPGPGPSDQVEPETRTRRPWRAPELIFAKDQVDTAKTTDTLPEGHGSGTTPIS
jgi:hypothetical protein